MPAEDFHAQRSLLQIDDRIRVRFDEIKGLAQTPPALAGVVLQSSLKTVNGHHTAESSAWPRDSH